MKIMLSGLFADKPIYRKFFIVVSIVLFCTLIFSMVGALLVDFIYGVAVLNDPNALSNLENKSVVEAMKLLQMISTGIGMFILPSLIIAWLFSHDPIGYLSLKKQPGGYILFLTVLIMFAAVPGINVLLAWNQQLQLPAFLSGMEDWMKSSEDQAMKLTEALLNINTTSDLLYNLLIIAILPAIGEELLFRGVLQKLFTEITRNVHASILITAIIFSAIHMQFYGFLPRMMLGVLFGYLLFWTGSLWVPILGHFINNGAAVLLAYYSGKDQLAFDQDTIGTMEGEWVYVVVSIVALSAALISIRNISAAKTISSS